MMMILCHLLLYSYSSAAPAADHSANFLVCHHPPTISSLSLHSSPAVQQEEFSARRTPVHAPFCLWSVLRRPLAEWASPARPGGRFDALCPARAVAEQRTLPLAVSLFFVRRGLVEKVES